MEDWQENWQMVLNAYREEAAVISPTDGAALREAERYCLGAENITGHCIRELLDRLPAEDD